MELRLIHPLSWKQVIVFPMHIENEVASCKILIKKCLTTRKRISSQSKENGEERESYQFYYKVFKYKSSNVIPQLILQFHGRKFFKILLKDVFLQNKLLSSSKISSLLKSIANYDIRGAL